MTNGTENPCLKGLTPDCFKQDPQWAKQAFAYRLIHVLFPRAMTRRLPKGLRQALIYPGVTTPPGVDLPPGTVIQPGTTFPPGWTPGDPTPPGIVIPPGTSFPSGWQPGDPEPPGVIVPPDRKWPLGWNPGDPLPAGALPAPPAPPDTGPTGPINTQPGPGPGAGGGSYSSPTAPGYFFYEVCDTFPGTFWTDTSVGGGAVSAVSGRFYLVLTWGNASCSGTVPDAWPTDYDIYFTINSIACDSTFVIEFYTGTHRINFLFNCPTDTLKFRTSGGIVDLEIYDIEGKTITYTLSLRSGLVDIWRDSTLIGNDLTPEADATNPGKISMTAANQGEYYIDDIFVVDRD